MRHLSLYLSVAVVALSLFTSAFATNNPGKKESEDEKTLAPVALELKSGENQKEAISEPHDSIVNSSLITPNGSMEDLKDKNAPSWANLAALNLENCLVPRELNDLPNELLAKIFGKLPMQDLGNAAKVCQLWNAHSTNEVTQDVQRLLDLRSFAASAKLPSLETLLTDPKYADLQVTFKKAIWSTLLREGQDMFIEFSRDALEIDNVLAQGATRVGTCMAYNKAKDAGNKVRSKIILMEGVEKRQLWALDEYTSIFRDRNSRIALYNDLFKTRESNPSCVNSWLSGSVVQTFLRGLWGGQDSLWNRFGRFVTSASNNWLFSRALSPQETYSNSALSKISEVDFLKWAIEHGNSVAAFECLRNLDTQGLQWKAFLQTLVQEKGHLVAASCLLMDELSTPHLPWWNWVTSRTHFETQLRKPAYVSAARDFDDLLKNCISKQALAQKIFGATAKTEEGWSKLCQILTKLRVRIMLDVLKAQHRRNDPLIDYTLLVDQVTAGDSFAVQELAGFLVRQRIHSTHSNRDWYFKMLHAHTN